MRACTNVYDLQFLSARNGPRNALLLPDDRDWVCLIIESILDTVPPAEFAIGLELGNTAVKKYWLPANEEIWLNTRKEISEAVANGTLLPALEVQFDDYLTLPSPDYVCQKKRDNYFLIWYQY